MTGYLAHLCGGLLPAMLAALAFAAGFAGTGYGFLRICGLGRGLMRGLTLWLVSLAAGFAVCAFFSAAVLMSLGTGKLPSAVCLFPVLAGIVEGPLRQGADEQGKAFAVRDRRVKKPPILRADLLGDLDHRLVGYCKFA